MTPLRVLHLEDNEADAEVVTAQLTRVGVHAVGRRVDSAAAFHRALNEFAPHVVLSDHGMPTFTALDALKALKAFSPATPFIVVTGAFNEEAAVSWLRAGADDLVLKSNLGRLGPVLEEARAVRAGLDALTPRQLEVLHLVVQSHTNRDIADRLHLSLKTVEAHRTAMMKRLRIHDVAALVRYAVAVRLIPPDACSA